MAIPLTSPQLSLAGAFFVGAGRGRAARAVGGEEGGDDVGTVETLEGADDVVAVGAVVPEEVFALGELLVAGGRGVDPLAGVGVVAGVVYLGGYGHRGGGEVLYLLQVHVETLGLGGEARHVNLATSGMARDEVGDELLPQPATGVHIVKNPLEVVEL